MTNVHSKFLKKSPGYRGCRSSAGRNRYDCGDPFTIYDPGEITQVSSMTNVHSKFLDKSPGYRGSRLSEPETR